MWKKLLAALWITSNLPWLYCLLTLTNWSLSPTQLLQAYFELGKLVGVVPLWTGTVLANFVTLMALLWPSPKPKPPSPQGVRAGGNLTECPYCHRLVQPRYVHDAQTKAVLAFCPLCKREITQHTH